MTPPRDTPTAAVLRSARRGRGDHAAGRALRLLPSDDGWSLTNADGLLLYRGLGPRSRRQCLARARELGALTVLG